MWYSWDVPRFEPFTGLRYDPAIPLDKVIAPPYDIVDAEERARLAGRHLANAILVELPLEDPRTGLDRYQSAAAYLARWMEEGVLQREARPAFYAYASPKPDGIEAAALEPDGAFWSSELGEFLLPYDAVGASADPRVALLEFLESSYLAGAERQGCDAELTS